MTCGGRVVPRAIEPRSRRPRAPRPGLLRRQM